MITDNKKIDKIRKGNKQIFNDLFREYYAKLCSFAFKFVKTKDVSEEIVQDVFVYLWENAEKINIELSLKSYLYSATRNKSLNFLKKNKFENELIAGDNSKLYYEVNEEIADETHLKNKLKKAIVSLPEKCKNIFILSKNEGLTYDEIANYLQISKKTVENQMGIAFKKLRESFIPTLMILAFL